MVVTLDFFSLLTGRRNVGLGPIWMQTFSRTITMIFVPSTIAMVFGNDE